MVIMSFQHLHEQAVNSDISSLLAFVTAKEITRKYVGSVRTYSVAIRLDTRMDGQDEDSGLLG